MGTGHSHVRASFLGPDLVVPSKRRKLLFGIWQQIVFAEFWSGVEIDHLSETCHMLR